VKPASGRRAIGRLYAIRRYFGANLATEKLALLRSIAESSLLAAADVRRLHNCLCFMRAFPDNADIRAMVLSLLNNFEDIVAKLSEGQNARLADSGIAGTDFHYPFSFEVASWMAQRFPGVAQIDWKELPDGGHLDELLEHLLEHAESDYFHGGEVSTEQWLKIATANCPGTSFDWLMAQLAERPQHERFWAALYNAIDLPLACRLPGNLFSRTGNALPVDKAHYRTGNMQNRVAFGKREIVRPVPDIRRVSETEANRILDVARSSLALRHRETDHFNNANPCEVYVAKVGRGIQVVLNGQLPERRDPLECTLGYLILSNGVPIGYGGASILFHQANTGVNIFDEYRGSEAAWLWTQVMRVVHAQTGCNRFIANPYQFGEENAEALKSGAFWFYYRLGYRPVDPGIRQLARSEFRKIEKRKSYRSSAATLKELATCDMHLTLPGARQSQLFDESWIEVSARLATATLADTQQVSRKKALDAVVSKVMTSLGVRTSLNWPEQEKLAFTRFCPIIATIDMSGWKKRERQALLQLMRAKGGDLEIEYARQLRDHERLFSQLKSRCRRAAGPAGKEVR